MHSQIRNARRGDDQCPKEPGIPGEDVAEALSFGTEQEPKFQHPENDQIATAKPLSSAFSYSFTIIRLRPVKWQYSVYPALLANSTASLKFMPTSFGA